MADCKIMKCSCKHEFQDEKYGKGNRIFNPAGKGSDQGKGYRCTVCGAAIGSASSKKK